MDSSLPAATAGGWRLGSGRAVRAAGWLGGAILGAELVVAAVAKTLDPAAFAEQIGAEGLAWGLSAGALAIFFVGLEAALGVALLCGLCSRRVLAVATAIVALFLFLTGRAYARQLAGLPLPVGGCGCFGALVERTPAEAFFQDFAVLVPALALAWWGRTKERGAAWKWAAVAFFAVLTLILATLSPRLPLDDLATRLSPGARIAALCAGEGEARLCLDGVAPELATGGHWVVLAALDDPAFVQAVPALNRLALGAPASALVVLGDFTDEQSRRFFWQHAPAFSLRAAPAALLRPLYRRLPRSFRLAEGKVVATYPGLPPEAPAIPSGGQSR